MGGPSPTGLLRGESGDRYCCQNSDMEKELEAEPQASLPLPNASTPMSAGAGMVLTEMNTPIKVLDRASVIDRTPPLRPGTRR